MDINDYLTAMINLLPLSIALQLGGKMSCDFFFFFFVPSQISLNN